MDPLAVQRLNVGAALPEAASAPARIGDEVGAAAELALGHLRFHVPWRRAQPKPGALDGSVVEELRFAAESARAAGIEPWFCLLQPEVPTWFENDGGWLDASTAGRAWPRWVETVADALGDVAAGWVPFEAPFAIARRLAATDPRTHGEVTDTLVVAWRDAWRILAGGPEVMTSLDVKVVRAADETVQAAELARREDALRWRLWLQGLRDGIVSIPGRADRELAGLSGACDVVGVAVTGDVETVLYRTAEMAPDRPLALTFRPPGDDEVTRNSATERMWREATRSAAEVGLRSVSVIVDAVPAAAGAFDRG